MSPANPTPEEKLVRGLREGDFEAFEHLYQRYKGQLAANFVRLLQSDTLAQDALQDLFLKVWSARATIDPMQSFRSYLYRIAENQVIDIYRKAARNKRVMWQLLDTAERGYAHVEEGLIREENISMVRQIIAQLPKQQQKVYILHKLEGKSYKEISEQLSISPSTINKHIYHAHRFVKSQIIKSPQFASLLLLIALLTDL